jgi:hypothetical protein
MKIDIEKLRQLMHDLSREKGEFSFFALFLREDAPNVWDLVVSSPWLKARDLKTLGEFVERLIAAIGKEQVLSISRVVALDADDPAFDDVTVSLEDGLIEIRDADFFGMRMTRGYILRSKPRQVSAQVTRA